jgi:hypothetical protein
MRALPNYGPNSGRLQTILALNNVSRIRYQTALSQSNVVQVQNEESALFGEK